VRRLDRRFGQLPAHIRPGGARHAVAWSVIARSIGATIHARQILRSRVLLEIRAVVMHRAERPRDLCRPLALAA
jgi:hypothetical protein